LRRSGEQRGHFFERSILHVAPLHLALVPMQHEGTSEISQWSERKAQDTTLIESTHAEARQHAGASAQIDKLAHLQHRAALKSWVEIHADITHRIAHGGVGLSAITTGSKGQRLPQCGFGGLVVCDLPS